MTPPKVVTTAIDQDSAEVTNEKCCGSNADDVFPVGRTFSVNQIPRQKKPSNDPNYLRSFPKQNHSLRINVSELAACAGFHPYKCLPKLLYEHVYQGIPGQALLQHDAALLGMQVISDQQLWQELAQKAGAATQQAMTRALQVQTGQTKVSSVEAAEILRRTVVQEAKISQRLTARQLATLEEGARHSIHTGFGTVWESQALDMYEKQCGWEVTERNIEVRVWDFDSDGRELGPPRPSSHRHLTITKVEDTITSSDGQHQRQENKREKKRQKAESDGDTVVVYDLTACIDDVSTDEAHSDYKDNETISNDSATSLNTYPFFSLRGSIDGIREEMAPFPKDGTKEDSFEDDVTWVLRKVIVECKHRMHQLQATPPLYEMIQATAYCLMYDAEEADLVQVLRTDRHHGKTQRSTKRNLVNAKKSVNKITKYLPKEIPQAKTESTKQNDVVTLDTSSLIETVHGITTSRSALGEIIEPSAFTPDKNTSKSSEDAIDHHAPKAPEFVSNNLDISVYRISIDSVIFQHRQNWHKIVLPRLSSWTEGVYSVRNDDNKRYRLLLALSEERLQDAWIMLLDECPWLRDCDTSYDRDLSVMNKRPD